MVYNPILGRTFWIWLLAVPLLLGAERGDFPGLEAEDFRLFRSNSMGMPLEEIDRYRKDEFSYVLSLYREEDREVRRLYEEGRFLTEWERTYRGGRLVREEEKTGESLIERHYKRGLLTEERVLKPDQPEERRKYLYGKKGSLREISLSREGELVYRDTYLTDRRGRLLEVRRTEGEAPPRLNLYGRPSPELSREWHQSEGLAEYFQFRKGDLEVREVRREGRLTEKEVWTVVEEGRMSRLTLSDEGREIIQLFDEEGTLISREENGPDGTVRAQHVYADGLLTEKVERRPGERIKYTYGYEGERLVEEQMEKNGLLVSRILFEGDGRERRETYRRGRLLVTVIYENDLPLETIYHGEETRLD